MHFYCEKYVVCGHKPGTRSLIDAVCGCRGKTHRAIEKLAGDLTVSTPPILLRQLVS